MRTCWLMWEEALPEELINQIIEKAGETAEAKVFNGAVRDVRKSRVSWLKDEKWLFDILHDFADSANQQAFNTNIYKNAPMQFTEYHASEGGHYDWHHDVNWLRDDGLDRKLSVTVQLSDPSEYEGGDFEFFEAESPDPALLKKKGTVLVFPSYLRHRVSPVTKGVRRSLVSWFEGPRWA
jgi:PKHD-type hydroxylase